MSEKTESEEFDEDADELASESDDVDLDRVTKDLEMAKRRGNKGADPAWRRLELLMEQKRTAELLSDFDDYDLDLPGTSRRSRAR
jgi:hypothetical protein